MLLCLNCFNLKYWKFQVDFEVTLPTENSKDKVFRVSKESGLGIQMRVSSKFCSATIPFNLFYIIITTNLQYYYKLHFFITISPTKSAWSKCICQTISYIVIKK